MASRLDVTGIRLSCSGYRRAGSSNDGFSLNQSINPFEALDIVSFSGWGASLGPWRCLHVCGVVDWSAAYAWALHTPRPIINHIAGFLSGQVSRVEGQENGLHVCGPRFRAGKKLDGA